MSGAGTRFGVGTRLAIDGEMAEIVELVATQAGNEVILKRGRRPDPPDIATGTAVFRPGTRHSRRWRARCR